MTTIAWDGQRLVSDTLGTANGVKLIAPSKKLHIKGRGELGTWKLYGTKVLAFGISGDAMGSTLLKGFLAEDLRHTVGVPGNTGNFSALMITEDKKAWRFTYRAKSAEGSGVQLVEIDGKCSIGSGGSYANAVMSIGLNAVEGLRAARNIDPHTGGNLLVWDFDEPEVISEELGE